MAERIFLVDNTFLGSPSDGLIYRLSKDLDDRDDDCLAEWGSRVKGVDERDGWLRVGRHYLPMTVRGARVIKQVAEEAKFDPLSSSKVDPLSTSVNQRKPEQPSNPLAVGPLGNASARTSNGGGYGPLSKGHNSLFGDDSPTQLAAPQQQVGAKNSLFGDTSPQQLAAPRQEVSAKDSLFGQATPVQFVAPRQQANAKDCLFGEATPTQLAAPREHVDAKDSLFGEANPTQLAAPREQVDAKASLFGEAKPTQLAAPREQIGTKGVKILANDPLRGPPPLQRSQSDGVLEDSPPAPKDAALRQQGAIVIPESAGVLSTLDDFLGEKTPSLPSSKASKPSMRTKSLPASAYNTSNASIQHRHDFGNGWARCASCNARCYNRGCPHCKARFCKPCSREHRCELINPDLPSLSNSNYAYQSFHTEAEPGRSEPAGLIDRNDSDDEAPEEPMEPGISWCEQAPNEIETSFCHHSSGANFTEEEKLRDQVAWSAERNEFVRWNDQRQDWETLAATSYIG